MRPTTQDIQRLVSGLLEVARELNKARTRQGEASRLAILQLASGGTDVRPSDIAADLELSLSSVTRQVHALVDAGLVGLTEDPHDRRSFVVTVNPAGQEEIDRLVKVAYDRFAVFLSDWEAGEAETLGRLLGRLADSVKAANAQEKRVTAGRRWQGSS